MPPFPGGCRRQPGMEQRLHTVAGAASIGQGAPVYRRCARSDPLAVRGACPFIDEKFSPGTTPRDRFILGYSLAGLTALYAMYVTEAFGGCAGCSGSLWYDGWQDFMSSNHPYPGARIYLSLGKKEEKSRTARMAAVGDATRAAHRLLSEDTAVKETELIWNDGGHFSNIPERIAKAMVWLCR